MNPKLLVALALAAALSLIAWLFFIRAPGAPPVAVPRPVEKLDTSVLTDPRFAGLTLPAGLPVRPGPLGRSNPFAPVAPEVAAPPTSAAAGGETSGPSPEASLIP